MTLGSPDNRSTAPEDGFFMSLVEERPDPVVTVDRDGTVIYANPATEEVFGSDTDALVGRSLATLIADEVPIERAAAIGRRLANVAELVGSGDTTETGGAGEITFVTARADSRTATFSVRFHEHETDQGAVYTGVFSERPTERTNEENGESKGENEGIGESEGMGKNAGNGENEGRDESEADRDTEPRSTASENMTPKTFRNLVEHAGHAIYVTDTDGTIEYVNPAFAEHTGYDATDAIGRTPAILDSGKMPAEYFESLWETLQAGEVWEEEIINRQKNGELYHAYQTIAPVIDDEEISRFVAIQTDVSKRKTIEGQLKQYRDIVEQLDEPIFLQNRDGTFELLNEAVTGFAGVPREELYGTDEFAFLDPETAAEIDKRRRTVLDTEEPTEYEISLMSDRSGREATFNTRWYPYYDANGNLAGTFAICHEITDAKAREAELEQYERAVNGATDLIAAVDRDGHLLFANPQYRVYHGIEREDVTDLTLADVLADGRYTEAEPHVDRALQGRTIEYRTTRTHPTRGTRTFDVRYYPLRTHDVGRKIGINDGDEGDDSDRGDSDGGDVGGVVGVLRDVTEGENRARQLRVVDRVLQHNLRNALTVIRGRAMQITDGAGTDADQGASVDMADAASYIVSRADELLTTSEKAHHITETLGDSPETEPIDVTRTIEHFVSPLDTEFPDATISLSIPDDEVPVVSATTWIDRALGELVRNAIVHHDRDRPVVDISVRATADAIEIRIADDGPGLTEMNRDVLETGRAVDALYHGSGLGLWMVYWVIQQSGGSATVHDADPRGTVVTVTLPRSDR